MLRVSVIIPTYNRQDDVIQAIESVQNQTYQPHEIIIVDDGSTDRTTERINKLARPVHYIQLEHSGLPAVARNAGIRFSSGDVIAFLDSDDRWLPNKLEQQLNYLVLYPSISMVCSNAYIATSGEVLRDKTYHSPEKLIAPPIFEELIRDNFVITSTVIARREGLEEAGYFSERAEICAIEDYDLWLRIAAIREIAYSPSVTTLYNIQSDTNLRSTRRRSQHALALAVVFQNLYSYLATHGISDITLYHQIDERMFHYRWKHLLYAWSEKNRTGSTISTGKFVWKYKSRFIRWLYVKVNRLEQQTVL